VTPKTTPLQSPGSEVPPSLSQDPAESREEKNQIEIEKTGDVSLAKPYDQPEQVHNSVEETGVEIRPSSEEICLMAVESEPIIEEKQVHEEVNEKEILQVDPGVVQEEIQEKLETAEHTEHSGPEVDMTGSNPFSVIILQLVNVDQLCCYPVFRVCEQVLFVCNN
jgi:hypothetical protein